MAEPMKSSHRNEGRLNLVDFPSASRQSNIYSFTYQVLRRRPAHATSKSWQAHGQHVLREQAESRTATKLVQGTLFKQKKHVACLRCKHEDHETSVTRRQSCQGKRRKSQLSRERQRSKSPALRSMEIHTSSRAPRRD